MLSKDTEVLRKTIFHLIEKIIIDNDKVKVYIDLMKYFNIPRIEGMDDIIICVVEDRNAIANKPKHQLIDFTNRKLEEAFKLLIHK